MFYTVTTGSICPSKKVKKADEIEDSDSEESFHLSEVLNISAASSSDSLYSNSLSIMRTIQKQVIIYQVPL